MDRIIKYLFLPFFLFLLFSCASAVNVDRKIQAATGIGKQVDPSAAIITVPVEGEPPPPIIIERPVFIPQGQPFTPSPQGRGAVQASNTQGIIEPQDYSNAAMLYDYDRDFVYELYCRPFRMSDITLQAGEQCIDAPFISDSERWMLGAGVSYEDGIAVQHIYVKPTAAGLEASLIINTDYRVYHLILRSFTNIHMPIVRWRYHDRDRRQNFVPRGFGSGGGAPPGAVAPAAAEGEHSVFGPDPRFMSFNYKITYGVFRKPKWLPSMAYDDGKKTYVTFPPVVLQTEMPAVFENRADVVNYRIHDNVMIIDKLIEQITIKLGNRLVTIEKRKGER